MALKGIPAIVCFAFTVYLMGIVMPFSAEAQTPPPDHRAEQQSFFQMTPGELSQLSTILGSDPELFQYLDQLYRSDQKEALYTLLSRETVVPSLLYSLENNVSPEFETEILRRFEFNQMEQARVLKVLAERVQQNPGSLRRLKVSLNTMLNKVQKLKPQWKWHGNRLINVGLLCSGMIGFLYSFEASFVLENVREHFAQQFIVVRNLMLLYATVPIISDFIALKREIKSYFSQRSRMRQSEQGIKNLSVFLREIEQREELSPYLEVAKQLGNPTLQSRIEMWSLDRQRKLLNQIKTIPSREGFVNRLKERGLIKDLNQFQAFLKDLRLEGSRVDQVPGLNEVAVAATLANKESFPIAEQELVEAEFNELNKFTLLDQKHEKAIQGKLERNNLMLSIGLGIIGFHASLGANPDALDSLFGSHLMEFIRHNTQLVYISALLTALVPMGDFWLGLQNLSQRLQLKRQLIASNNAIDALFTIRFPQQRPTSVMRSCSAIFQ